MTRFGIPVSSMVRGFFRDRTMLVAFVAGAVLRLVLALTTPLLYAPDETGHVLYVHEAAHGSLPVNSQDWQWSTNAGADEFFQPPLFYLLAAPVYRLFLPLGAPAVYAVRLMNVALGLAVVILAWQLARLVIPDRPRVARIAAVLVAFLPTFIGNSSSVNNDVLCAVLVGIGTIMIVDSVRSGAVSGRRVVGLAVVLAVGMWTKSSAAVLVPTLLLAGLLLRARGRPGLLRAALAAGAGVLAVLPWWLIRNERAYGSLLATGTNYPRWSLPLRDKLSVAAPIFAHTFWASFGRVYDISPLTTVSSSLSVVGVAVLILGAVGLRELRRSDRECLGLIAVQVALITAAAIFFALDARQPQGRYTYYALPAMAVLLGFGVDATAGWLRLRRRVWGWSGLGMAAVYSAVVLGIVVHYFPEVKVVHDVGGQADAERTTHDLATWVQERTAPVTR